MEAAIRSFNKPVILIAGGSEKGATFDSLIPAFRSSLKHAVLIGTTREKIAASVREAGKHSEFAPDMTSAVRQAFARSEIGDVILLSPGCASFDMFRDYLDRADKFREAFRALQEQSHKVDLST
jgi:UDP-N-acetylmuramoylalanine--D-glutamate ligase